MLRSLDEGVSVIVRHNHKSLKTEPVKIRWGSRDYVVTKIGYHHTFHTGRVLYHVYSVIAGALFFRLELNTENLHWRVKEVADGEAS